MSVVIPVSSIVDFPSTEPSPRFTAPHPIQTRPPHLPFRRISLPTQPPPNLKYRESVVSVASFESFPEDPTTPTSASPVVIRNGHAGRKTKGRPVSVEAARRGSRRRDLKPVDEARESRRKNVIQEFYETEKAYVDGLDLVYSVRPFLVSE